MIKRVLGIVLAVCMLATMCVGLSIAGSAAEATDIAYDAAPVAKQDAKNYVDLTKATVTGEASITDGKLSVKNGSADNKIDIPLNGLTAGDSYIVSFTTAMQGDWEPFIFRFAQDGDKFQGFTFRGKGSKYNEYETQETMNGLITRYKEILGIPAADETTINSNNFRTWPTENKVETRFDILVTKSVETGKCRILMFQDGVPSVCKKSEAGFDLKYEEFVQPHLVFVGQAGSKTSTHVVSDVKVIKLSDTEGYVDTDTDNTTTTTTTGATTTTTTGATTTTTAKPTTTTTTAPKKDIAFPNSPVPNKDAKNYADIDKATFTGSAEKLENGNLKNAGEDPNNGRTAGDVTVPLTGLKKTDSYVISFTTTMNGYDAWQVLKVRFAQSKDGKKFQEFDLRGFKQGAGAYHEFNNEIPMDPRIEADRIAQNNPSIDSNNYRGFPTGGLGETTRYEIVVTNSVETGMRRILLFQNGVPVVCKKTNAGFDLKNQEALDPCLVFVGQTNKTGSFEIQGLKVYKLSDTKNYGDAVTGGSSSNGATTGNASRAIGALAITACVALPVIFATKKRKEA